MKGVFIGTGKLRTIQITINMGKKGKNHLENSGCFLITSFSVARTAAMVSSEVP